jgi:signal peptidase I
MLLLWMAHSKVCHHVTMTAEQSARANTDDIRSQHERAMEGSPLVPSPTGSEPRQLFHLLRELVPMLLIVLVVFAGVRMFFQPYEVDGASMSPAIANGERLFVNRSAYVHVDLPALGDIYPFSEPQRGDIIVLESDRTSRDAPYIKRIIGLPGETITYTEGIVIVDGEPLVEDYINGAITGCHVPTYCSITVPQGHVYVLGDNRRDSEDSRFFGPVPMEDVVGKAFFSNWPYENIGPIQHPDYGEIRAGS